MPKFPENLKYSDSHEWVALDGATASVGITDYAQSELGDLVFINLPAVGDSVVNGDVFGDVESVKAVSDLISPISGTICAVNDALLDSPQLMNETPYEAWIIKVSPVTSSDGLLDSAAYERFVSEQ